MRSQLVVSLVACSLSLVAVACGDKSEGEKAARLHQRNPRRRQPARRRKSATGNATNAATADAPPQKLPERAGRSPAPTFAEWNSQQKEVTVQGSSALKCETKIVREYLRISCHGKNDTGGTPTNVVIKKGGKGEAFTYVGGGIASLVVPFVEGTDFLGGFLLDRQEPYPRRRMAEGLEVARASGHLPRREEPSQRGWRRQRARRQTLRLP